MGEKRKYIRFKLLLKGEIEIEAGSGLATSSEAYITDFSREGLRIFIPRKDFSKPDTVKLKVYMPNAHHPILIHAKVQWIKPKDDGLEIGTKIDRIDPEDKNEILDYAYEIWKEKKSKEKLPKISSFFKGK